ncbi:MAG: polysaccharide biosynthesis protein [Flavobacteriaceae bacterium]|nr:MAG: polysaccharide biosynthesis protein [Flavobacteriaceae bacterium]
MIDFILNKIIKHIVSRWLVMLVDIYIVINTFILAYLIHFNFQLNFDTSKLIIQIPFVVIAALIGFVATGSYKGIIRHTSFRDAKNVIIASLLMLIVLSVIVLVLRYFKFSSTFTIPLSILIIHFLLNSFVLIVSRNIFKEFYRILISNVVRRKRVLIYGAGASGLITYNVLNEDKNIHTKIVGFIDDDFYTIGKNIHGLRIFNPKAITEEFIRENKVEEIIISIQDIEAMRLREIAENLSQLPVLLKIVPPVKLWINNSLQSKQIKPLEIEDLLGRDAIKLNNGILENEFKNKVILVTGAAGSIGSEIARQLAEYSKHQLILIDQSESELYDLQQYFIHKGHTNIISIVADVRNKRRMEGIVKQYQPHIIYHAAAYKHVPLMEEYPNEAVATNVYGTKILVDLTMQFEVEKFIMISTDKAVNPTNIMGATKRIAELYINCLKGKSNTKFITTRFGNVLGSNGSVIPLFQTQIKNGGPLTVTHKDITRYFMTIPEACQLVLEAGCMGKGGEIFVFDMGESIKIYDLAKNMIRLSGYKYPKDITIEIIGLRPGEKIFEELLAIGEHVTETHHKKIKIAKVKQLDTALIKQQIEDLCTFNKELKTEEMVKKMKAIVPEYISNNSKFGVLDA